MWLSYGHRPRGVVERNLRRETQVGGNFSMRPHSFIIPPVVPVMKEKDEGAEKRFGGEGCEKCDT